MPSKEKPYVLLVAEAIYLKVCEIKKRNPELSNINAIENFIGSTDILGTNTLDQNLFVCPSSIFLALVLEVKS